MYELRVVESRVEGEIQSIIAAQCLCAFELIQSLGTSRYLKRAVLQTLVENPGNSRPG